MNYNDIENNKDLLARWESLSNPGDQHTEVAFSKFLQLLGKSRNVLHCAVPQTRAKTMTDFQLPAGVDFSSCLDASVTGNFPASLAGWEYNPKIRAVKQLPFMHMLPKEHASLMRSPWFQTKAPAAGLNINSRNLRYQHQLWENLKPKTLQGVFTTLVISLPQIGYALTPHIQLDKAFMFFGSMARALGPVQLFPAKFLYPDANLGDLAEVPAPIFSDILPTTGGFSYPVMEHEPDPWRVLAHYDRTDRYYGYPFSRMLNSSEDATLVNLENGNMLLPNGSKVKARSSQSYVYATLDPHLNEALKYNSEMFEACACMKRGTVTHDGLPFMLPVELQPFVYAVITTHWKLEMDKPGDLTSYNLSTAHAAIRGYNLFQRVEPYFSNYMRLLNELTKDPYFKVYPLASHLTDSWLGGNLRLSNQLSDSEKELSPELMRAFYHQQLDWQAGVVNLMNHTAMRTKVGANGPTSRTGAEFEKLLNADGVAFHQMLRLLRFDSHLFPRPLKLSSPWPDLHPGWADLDLNASAAGLPKL